MIEFEQKLVKNLFELQRPSVRRVHDSRHIGFYVTANLSRNEIEGHEKVHFKRAFTRKYQGSFANQQLKRPSSEKIVNENHCFNLFLFPECQQMVA